MDNQVILKKITGINLRQVIYVVAGLYFLITAIMNKDYILGIFSALFLYQGIFNTCLFGSCRIAK
jgi:hypothetical protein